MGDITISETVLEAGATAVRLTLQAIGVNPDGTVEGSEWTNAEVVAHAVLTPALHQALLEHTTPGPVLPAAAASPVALADRYAEHFVNTGNNPVPTLLHGNTNAVINLPLAMLEVAVQSQAGLLANLYRAGLLRDPIQKA